MAFSYAQYAGNGSTTTFSVPFPYLLKAHVKVYTGFNIINGTFTSLLVDGTDYTWTSATQLQTTVAPANGVTLTILRDTPDSSQLVPWQDGSNLIAGDLNTADLQNLYVVQEQQDRNDAGITQSTTAINNANTALSTVNALNATALLKDGSVAMTGNFNLGSNRIVSVAEPSGAQDAATKNYVDSTTWNTTTETVDSTEAWSSGNGVIATTGAIDSRIDSKIDTALVTDVVAGDGLTITDNSPSSGQITVGITNAGVTTAKIDTAAVTDAKIASGVDGAKITDGTLTANKLSGATVVTNAEVSGVSVNDTSFFTTSASDLRYFRQDSSETINSGMAWSGSDAFIATTAAIDARIIDLVDDVGGFVPIANETSFPLANPDINNPDGTGTIISIKEIAVTRTPASGTVTITNGAGSNTVTITGCGSTVLAAGFGVLVETTATLHTYTFHRLVPKATEVTTVASISGNVTTVAGISSNVTTVAGISGNVTTVASNIADIQTVAADLNEPVSEIDTVATNIANVNAVGSNIANVNTVATNDANVTTVATSIANVNTTAGSIANVNTTAGSIANVNTVAGIGSNVTTVAGISSNVTTVAGISGNVTTVANNNANVTTVATNTANINTAATYLNAFLALYLGQASADPALDALGNPITTGDLYFNNVQSQIRVYNGTAWQSFAENAFGSTYFPDKSFSAVYTATAGSNTIDLGSLAITGGVFPDENSPANRMSLALGATSYNLGGL